MSAETAEPLRVAVLGPVRAWRGEVELDLGAARKRSVFAMLAVRANQVVSREQLIDGVWGEASPTSADGSLYTYVSALRRALEPDRFRWTTGQVLTSAGSGYSLKLEPHHLDVHRFDEYREDAQRRWAAKDYHGALAALNDALALWQGDALSGIPGPFAELHRARLGELRLATVERRAEAMVTIGEHAEAAVALSALVREFPLREGLRGLLMLALHRSGRSADALEVYRDARTVLIEDLGIEPGPALRRIHEQILANDPALAPPPSPDVPVMPRTRRQVAAPSAPPAPPREFAGRVNELGVLHRFVNEVVNGRGRCLWVEGEPGVGKSGLLAAGLARAADGCQVMWGSCDELGQRFPLRALIECLGVHENSSDPRRASVARELGANAPVPGAWRTTDPVLAGVDRLLALVDQLCSDAPVVLVVDDLQWADEASLLVWHRLSRATQQLPLLLVGACRPVPRRAELEQLRASAATSGGEVLTLGRLADAEVTDLVTRLVRAMPGVGLVELTGRASGNPLYVREMVEALVHEGAVGIEGGVADVADAGLRDVPATLAAAVTRRLGFLDSHVRDVLRWAALLGVEFDLQEAAVVLGRSASDLIAAIEGAVEAGVLVDAGHRLAFRHPLIRHALYEGMPASVRTALHRQAAEALATAGSPVAHVAAQLMAAPAAVDGWVVAWLLHNTTVLAGRAPGVAVELLQRVVAAESIPDSAREVLTARLARLLFWLGREPASEARAVLSMTRDPDRAAEMRTVLAHVRYRRGDVDAALADLRATVADERVPEVWRARAESMQAMIERCGLDELETAEATARRALARADDVGDSYATAHALQGLWQVESVRRNHTAALAHIDQALTAVADTAELADLRLNLLDNRIFTLQNLDRLAEAGDTLTDAYELVTRRALPGGLHIAAAVHQYWLGRWDDALVELDAVAEDGPEITFYGQRQRGPVLLLHGVAALIAGHRQDTTTLDEHLHAAERHPLATIADRENCDFLVAATALAAELRGDPRRALEIWEPTLDRRYARMMLRHQWLPQVVRLALALGDPQPARRALEVCEAEASAEGIEARAWAAAARCRGMVSGDPEPVLAAVEHYRRVGRRLEAAHAGEDLAAVLAAAGHIDDARRAFVDAVTVYTDLGAAWDVRRAEARLRTYGLRRASSVPLPGPGSGWEALSDVEKRIAAMVSAGLSNPDIAAELTLSRRTVQVHVSHILQKLRVESRHDVAALQPDAPVPESGAVTTG